MLGFLVLCLASFAILAGITSALVWVVEWSLRPATASWTATARARFHLTLLLAPLIVASGLLFTTLAPSFGWMLDHCHGGSAAAHGHGHICADHGIDGSALNLPLLSLATVLLLRVAVQATQLVRALVSARRQGLALDAASELGPDGLRVLPLAVPRAFVLGLLRPQTYLTQGLLDNPGHLAVVLAHEEAHVARRDPLRNFLGAVGSAFHLPLLARRLRTLLACDHEMAADESAAARVGNRHRVARTLVALARAQPDFGRVGLAFTGSDIARRVDSLLDNQERHDRLQSKTLAVLSIAFVAFLALRAHSIHHTVERLIAAMGS